MSFPLSRPDLATSPSCDPDPVTWHAVDLLFGVRARLAGAGGHSLDAGAGVAVVQPRLVPLHARLAQLRTLLQRTASLECTTNDVIRGIIGCFDEILE